MPIKPKEWMEPAPIPENKVGIYEELKSDLIQHDPLKDARFRDPQFPREGDLYCAPSGECGIVTKAVTAPLWEGSGFLGFTGVELDDQVSVDTRVSARPAEHKGTVDTFLESAKKMLGLSDQDVKRAYSKEVFMQRHRSTDSRKIIANVRELLLKDPKMLELLRASSKTESAENCIQRYKNADPLLHAVETQVTHNLEKLIECLEKSKAKDHTKD